jgi:hypothetical protein
MLQLSVNCWSSAVNARGSRLIIVVVQLKAVKIHVAGSGGAPEKGKTGWNSVYHQNWWFSQFHPTLNANVLFWRFFKNLTLCLTKLRVGSGAAFLVLYGRLYCPKGLTNLHRKLFRKKIAQFCTLDPTSWIICLVI